MLLDIDFEDVHIQEFTNYCRKLYQDNVQELRLIEEFGSRYDAQKSLWWYTCECFLHPVVNRALRTMDFHVLIKAGFFIRDLHRQIQHLHMDQFGEQHNKKSLLRVYRGQGMPRPRFRPVTTFARRTYVI